MPERVLLSLSGIICCMACQQPTAPQQRTLVLKGVLDLPKSLNKFGMFMPLHAELDGLVRSGHPTLLAHKNWLSARSGDVLLYPERDGSFPAHFKYKDGRAGMAYCVDTSRYMHIRGIALLMLRDTFRFRFQGDEMLFFPTREPIVLQFPQHSGWHPYDPRTFIPVSSGGIVDAGGIMTGRRLERTDGPWLGCPTRDINRGNNDEKEVFACDLPSVPRAVFAWDGAATQPRMMGEAPRRGIVTVPANYPVAGEAQKAVPAVPGIPAYSDFIREWNIRGAQHEQDPGNFPDPGPCPPPAVFERLLREGKIRIEK